MAALICLALFESKTNQSGSAVQTWIFNFYERVLIEFFNCEGPLLGPLIVTFKRTDLPKMHSLHLGLCLLKADSLNQFRSAFFLFSTSTPPTDRTASRANTATVELSPVSTPTSLLPKAAISSTLVAWQLVQVKVFSPFSVAVAAFVTTPLSQLYMDANCVLDLIVVGSGEVYLNRR